MAGLQPEQISKIKELHLPVSRVKTIMKSSPDVESVGPEPLFLVTKVTELFIADLAKTAYRKCKTNNLEYKHIANIVQTDDTLDFLREIMPCKITVKHFKELMARKAAKGDETDTTSEEESSEEDGESGEEEANQQNCDKY